MLNPFIALIFDAIIFALNCYIAISQRGTWIGWLFTGLVIWHVFVVVKAFRS